MYATAVVSAFAHQLLLVSDLEPHLLRLSSRYMRLNTKSLSCGRVHTPSSPLKGRRHWARRDASEAVSDTPKHVVKPKMGY
ncbi:hypothetical protein NDU88_000126 [Pleurodeles waltl]|uniref:Secreted protein n=1 Tax=Pleurodeles waltl TaxID=8319 RepID=A0AAV7KM68_PLEWA|nr:hypothetical protein NDU88_000126 [Pleurodeles waltl]